MGKDDPETTALKKELEDLINKCKVFFGSFLQLNDLYSITLYNVFAKSRNSLMFFVILLFHICLFLHQEDQKKQQDTTLEQACSGVADAPKVKLSTKKLLKGHINKVNSVHFSGDSRSVLINSSFSFESLNRKKNKTRTYACFPLETLS